MRQSSVVISLLYITHYIAGCSPTAVHPTYLPSYFPTYIHPIYMKSSMASNTLGKDMF